MEQNIIIHIGSYEALAVIVTVVAAIVAGTWKAASKLTEVVLKIDIFEDRLTSMEGRLDSVFAGASPLSLLPKGEKILEESGLKQFIDDRKEHFLEQCKSKAPMQNPYDVQHAAFQVFDELKFDEALNEAIKTTAFNHGVSVETVRRVGSIYLRDVCLEASGFKPEDLPGDLEEPGEPEKQEPSL